MTREFRFATRYLLTFSAKEIELLAEHSIRHYDMVCRELSRPGGVISGLINSFQLGANPVVAEIDRRTLDLLCKVMEHPSTPEAADLGSSLRTTLLEQPLETFLNGLAIEVVHAENERDSEDAAASVAEFMESHGMDAKRLRSFLGTPPENTPLATPPKEIGLPASSFLEDKWYVIHPARAKPSVLKVVRGKDLPSTATTNHREALSHDNFNGVDYVDRGPFDTKREADESRRESVNRNFAMWGSADDDKPGDNNRR